ncbi:MAG: molecular chaperone [Halanaeroarchaeum sp.]
MSATVSAQEFARARARLYDLLARVFDGEMGTFEGALGEHAFTEFAGLFPSSFDTEALERDLDEEALSVGYDNLFVVPGPHYVPPFASAHADDPSESFESDSPYHEAGEAGELFGDPAKEIAALYERTGFRPTHGDDIPDHVAAELEYLAALADREATLVGDDEEALAEIRSIQRSVLDALDWLDAFAATVENRDNREGVFAALAAFTASYVAWDRAAMDEED